MLVRGPEYDVDVFVFTGAFGRLSATSLDSRIFKPARIVKLLASPKI